MQSFPLCQPFLTVYSKFYGIDNLHASFVQCPIHNHTHSPRTQSMHQPKISKYREVTMCLTFLKVHTCLIWLSSIFVKIDRAFQAAIQDVSRAKPPSSMLADDQPAYDLNDEFEFPLPYFFCKHFYDLDINLLHKCVFATNFEIQQRESLFPDLMRSLSCAA